KASLEQLGAQGIDQDSSGSPAARRLARHLERACRLLDHLSDGTASTDSAPPRGHGNRGGWPALLCDERRSRRQRRLILRTPHCRCADDQRPVRQEIGCDTQLGERLQQGLPIRGGELFGTAWQRRREPELFRFVRSQYDAEQALLIVCEALVLGLQ